MHLNPDDVNVRAATFGRIVEDFKSSPVGRYLIDRAEIQLSKSLDGLKDVDASDEGAVRKLQLDARVAYTIIEWLGNAIFEGRSALDQLREDFDE